MLEQMTPRQLAEKMASGDDGEIQIVDVREPWELDICVLPGVVAIPMQQIPQRLGEISTILRVVCVCHHGGRSQEVANYLLQQGLENVANLNGGMDTWARTVDPEMAVY